MSLKLHLRGGIWHYRGTVAKRRVRGTTGTSNKEEALRYAAEREAELRNSASNAAKGTLTFSQAAILYLQAEKPTRFVDKVSSYWKETPVRKINAGAVRQAAITQLPNAGPATRNRHFIVPTQAIINHAADQELCPHLKVKRFSVVTKKKDYATETWIGVFMNHASPHLGALACFMFLTGARITEALNVTWADVDMNARRVTIRQGKLGGDERRPHMPPALVAALANIPSNRDAEERVFRYSSYHTAKWPWRDAIKRAGIKDLTFHACRHGFATSLLHAGVDVITVTKLGGWKDAKHVFSTYGHPVQDDTLANRIGTKIGTRKTKTVVKQMVRK